MTPERAISVRQPYARAITGYDKRVENRPRYWSHRGPIAIHASKLAEPLRAFEHVADLAGVPISAVQAGAGPPWRGALVAVAALTGVCSASLHVPAGGPLTCPCGPWAMPGQHHLQLANVQPLGEPLRCPGALGPWRIPPNIRALLPGGTTA